MGVEEGEWSSVVKIDSSMIFNQWTIHVLCMGVEEGEWSSDMEIVSSMIVTQWTRLCGGGGG